MNLVKKKLFITLLTVVCFAIGANAQNTKGIILEEDGPATNNWSMRVMNVQTQQDADVIYNAVMSKEGMKSCIVNGATGVTQITSINDITDLHIQDIIHFAGYLLDSNFTGLEPEQQLKTE